MINKIRCSRLLQIFVISLALLVITSCGKQGVISASSDSVFSEENAQSEGNQNLENSKKTGGSDAEAEKDEHLDAVYIILKGGTGKATIQSPASVEYIDGLAYVKLVWSSKNYDYMKVGEIKYLNENEGGDSTFTIPVESFDEPLNVIADTVAMSKPHEIEYTINFSIDESVDDAEDELAEVVQKENVIDSIDIGIEGKQRELKYAEQFEIIDYGDYSLLVIKGDASYLIVPKGKEVPTNLTEEVIVLKQPLDKTYLVSSSVMDLIRQCDAMDNIVLSGTKEQDWYIEEAAEAMADGGISYAGKYSAPDYELILGSGCNLAIENTMIYHKPEVKDKLEELGIPVLVERSSYESHPLGRLEWIKVYGLLYDREAEADAFFSEQVSVADQIMGEKRDVTVAFFYVTTGGMVNVRLSTDYIAKMIEMSGGKYCLTTDKESTSSVATLNMQMEDFYVEAGEADILIYNSTIGGEISSIDELIAKNALFKDFKAVKDGRVYCTSRDFFQETTGTVEFMNDLSKVYEGADECSYLVRLK